eukprot:gene14513-9704_t
MLYLLYSATFLIAWLRDRHDRRRMDARTRALAADT